ncbi:MAG: N-acetylmuramoyl-L-alanine amidase [bacterium]|nr:N-acetylmuramoyl-L-alanine amidase [bacterium]
MSDHPQDENNPENPEIETRQPPASVVFMEMMRRAASKNTPQFDDDEVDDTPPQEVVEAIIADEKVTPPPVKPLYNTPEERRRAAALEAERIRRIQRRQTQRKIRRGSMVGGFISAWLLTVISGGLIATILSWGTSPEALNRQLRLELGQIQAQADSGNALSLLEPTVTPTIIATPNFLRRIGIVSGHRGPQNDPGAVCPDGLTENSINYSVASRVVVQLRELGYTVDLLEEFDSRLENYVADILISLHSNDCRDYGGASGFLVAFSEARPQDGLDSRLMECIAQAYGAKTGLQRRFGLTRDMTDYHIFREIDVRTPGVILELGFMRDDRAILTDDPELLSDAVIEGVLCYFNPNSIVPTPTAP